MKPIIGITPLYDEKMDSYWLIPGYVDMVKYAGGIPLILTFTDNIKDVSAIVDKLDGFIIAGGPDVNPMIYGEEKLDICGDVSLKRDELELQVIIEAMKKNKPILGICRGFQLMNSFLGGSLYQDIVTQFESNVNHRQEKPYIKPCHNINVSGILKEITGKDSIMVNSCHHQGVKKLADCLEAVGYSDDSLVEAFVIKDYPFGMGVQWHPEMLYKEDEDSVLIFKAFVAACKK